MFGIAKVDPTERTEEDITCEIAKVRDGNVIDLKREKHKQSIVKSYLNEDLDKIKISYINEENEYTEVVDKQSCLFNIKNLIAEDYLNKLYIIDTRAKIKYRYSFVFPTGNKAKWEVEIRE